MIHIVYSRASPKQMRQMLENLGIYIKLAVDIERRILADNPLVAVFQQK